ncbi:MAG TPA: hypothetical protein VGJ29_13405 [Vicinamibacterales bacterium]
MLTARTTLTADDRKTLVDLADRLHATIGDERANIVDQMRTTAAAVERLLRLLSTR